MFAKMLPDMGLGLSHTVQFVADWTPLLENSWGRNPENPDYVEQGEITRIGDMEMYVVGEGPNAIIWNYGRKPGDCRF